MIITEPDAELDAAMDAIQASVEKRLNRDLDKLEMRINAAKAAKFDHMLDLLEAYAELTCTPAVRRYISECRAIQKGEV